MKKLNLMVSMLILFSFVKAQTIGTKVTFPGTDGRTYTGTIMDIRGDQFKIKYDGYDYNAWAVKSQFTVIGDNGTTNNAPSKTDNWQVGDKVEAFDIYTDKWENATILIVYTDRTPQQWRVSLDQPAGHGIADFPVTSANIRARGAKSAISFTVNSRVDVYYSSGGPKARGTVIAVIANGRYKVKYDGCKDYWDEEVDWSQLKRATSVSSSDADITAVMGKWAMFVYSYPNTVIRGNDIYREYGTGAKAPPLLINANGTFVWYDEFNKPPVKGNWTTHAKIQGLTMGTEAVNGIIIYDSRNNYWKIYKDRADHIEARLMCSGQTEGGTRIK